MRYTTFRYNAETCQYERVRMTIKGALVYSLGLTVMAACMLIAILFLHDWLVNTDREISLRRENKALERHHSELSAQLNELRPVLTSLENRDKILHKKFFGTQPVVTSAEIDQRSRQDLLLADADAFREQVELLSKTSESLKKHAAISNYGFSESVPLNRKSLPTLHTMPTLQPIHSWQPDRVISGYGLRVNPFHKGLYEHLGLDIAAPRGTPVVATASGKITQLKRSDLQAGYGNYVEIDHGNGLVTRYAHLEDIIVRFGAKVAKGETIGTVGSSGGSVAPHVHYEVIRDGQNVDPVYYTLEGITADEHHWITVRSHQQNQSLD